MKIYLSNSEVFNLVTKLSFSIKRLFPENFVPKVYGIPRGGVPVAYLLSGHKGFDLADTPLEADVLVDDIIDSGRTLEKWCDEYPGKPFVALIDEEIKEADEETTGNKVWYVFPWERNPLSDAISGDDSVVGTVLNRIQMANAPYFANDNISEFIQEDELVKLEEELTSRVKNVLACLLIDVDNDHNTKETAERVAKMYLHEVFKGRYIKPPTTTFFPNVKKLDELYWVGPITIRSTCSHHLVPIIGQCWIGIIPGENFNGLSKFNRVIEWLAARPQIQEELVVQIADKLEEMTRPLGVAVILKATHMCMTWRGVKEDEDSEMGNSVMRGLFKENPALRSEFLSLIKK